MTYQPELTEADLDAILAFITEGIELRIDDYRYQEPEEQAITGPEIRMGWHCLLALTKGTDRHEGIGHQIDAVRDHYFPTW